MDVTSKMTISQKAQRARHLDGIVEPPGRNIRLPNHRDACIGSADELAFHCGESYGLMPSDHFGLLVASRKGNQRGRNEPGAGSRAQIKLSLGRMQLPQRIERPNRRNHERARYESRHLIVGDWIKAQGFNR
jgi:hypothetical protein